MSDPIHIELAYATPTLQVLLSLELPAGATVADVLNMSVARRSIPAIDDARAVGVWGSVVTRSHPLRDGDRVEVYHALKLDPREARRVCATAGVTMDVGTGAIDITGKSQASA